MVSLLFYIYFSRETYFLNDAFHIWFNGHFVTINGKRIGNLKSQQIDPSEINAGWGYAAFLMESLRKKLNCQWGGILNVNTNHSIRNRTKWKPIHGTI